MLCLNSAKFAFKLSVPVAFRHSSSGEPLARPYNLLRRTVHVQSCDLSDRGWRWSQNQDNFIEILSETMPEKRKAEVSDSTGSKQVKRAVLVNSKRVRELKKGTVGDGPVLYW
jgi:hypothetical protein